MTDKSRFEAVLEILPEREVDLLVNEYLSNGRIPRKFLEIFSRYRDYEKEKLSSFSKRKIQKAFKKMNEKFHILNNFIIDHFSIPLAHYEMYDDPPFLYLEPRIHHNFRGSENGEHGTQDEDSMEWDSLLNRLNEYGLYFEKSYEKFINICRNIIDKEENGKKWWETSWFQALALIGTIASVIGIIIYFFPKPNELGQTSLYIENNYGPVSFERLEKTTSISQKEDIFYIKDQSYSGPKLKLLLAEPIDVVMNNGFFHVKLSLVMGVAAGEKAPILLGVNPPDSVKCQYDNILRQPAVAVSGDLIGRVIYTYRINCTSNKLFDINNFGKYEFRYDY